MGFGRTFDEGAEDYLDTGSGLANGNGDFTMICMARGTDSGSDAAVFWTGDTGSVNDFFGTLVNWPSSSEGIRMIVREGSNGIVENLTDFPDDVFTLVRGTRVVEAGDDTFRAGMDEETTSSTTSQDPADPVDGAIGGFRDSTDGNYWEGEILWLAVIAGDLDPSADADVIRVLTDGASPLHVARIRDNLVHIWFLDGRDPETDLVGGADMTNQGTSIFDDNTTMVNDFFGERMIAPP